MCGFALDSRSDVLAVYLILMAIKSGRRTSATREIMARPTIMVMIFFTVVSAPFQTIRAWRPGLFSCGIRGAHGFGGCLRLNSTQERAEKLCSIRRRYKQIMGAAIKHIEPQPLIRRPR